MDKVQIFSEEQEAMALECIRMALGKGADGVRATLSGTLQNTVATLDGALDKILSSNDKSLSLTIFAGGRRGLFSTNCLDGDSLEDFTEKAVRTTLLLEADPLRRLPDKAFKADNADDSDMLESYDPAFAALDGDSRIEAAVQASAIPSECAVPPGCSVVSIESEYTDYLDDTVILDSDGFRGRHRETSHSIRCEVTLQEDGTARRSSGTWWESAVMRGGIDPARTFANALEEAISKRSPRKIKSGKYTVSVDRKCATKLLYHLINAMDAYNVFQDESFLKGKFGQRLFPEALTVMDRAHGKRCIGSRTFDSEGLLCPERPIILEGVVKDCYADSYSAAKLGIDPSCDSASRPVVLPFACTCGKKPVNLHIASFNGGNCNAATGNFSFGIDGYVIEDGRRTHPFSEAVMTGDILSLWSGIIGAADDAFPGRGWQVPTLTFENVDINS